MKTIFFSAVSTGETYFRNSVSSFCERDVTLQEKFEQASLREQKSE